MKKIKAVQLFKPDYLKECRKLTPMQILHFLEDFRKIYGAKVVDPKIEGKKKLP